MCLPRVQEVDDGLAALQVLRALGQLNPVARAGQRHAEHLINGGSGALGSAASVRALSWDLVSDGAPVVLSPAPNTRATAR